MICHYLFFNHGFEFYDSVCNDCHDLTTLSVNIIDITIITIKNVGYRGIIHKISKSEVKFSQDFFKLFFFSIYKMVDSICIHKSLNIDIGTVMKNPEMLKFGSDQLKICVSMQLRYVSD